MAGFTKLKCGSISGACCAGGMAQDFYLAEISEEEGEKGVLCFLFSTIFPPGNRKFHGTGFAEV